MSSNNRGRGRGFPRGGGPSIRGNAPARGGTPPYRGATPSSHRGGRGGTREIVIFKRDSPATVQPHLSDQKLNSLISSLSPLRGTPERPVRPGFGTLGTPIKVRANFFAVKIKKGQKFYEYNVNISGRKEKIPNGMKIRLFELLELHPRFGQYNPYIAHDRSAKLYSAKQLPLPLVFDIKYFDDHKEGPEPNANEYRVELEFIKEHDLSALNEYVLSLNTCISFINACFFEAI
jgi:hypothetical protein